jgi:TPP-dependent pyruvate/acetoin dehydrogenase alpha subunit
MDNEKLLSIEEDVVAVENDIYCRFKRKEYPGTAHLSLGHEAIAAGFATALDSNDMMFCNHRSHHHFIARGHKKALYNALQHGMSQHIYTSNTLSNGIVGGLVPIAVGYAYSLKQQDSQNIAVAQFGDGAMAQGVVYESMNMADIWQLPIIFLCENNQVAMTTRNHTDRLLDKSACFIKYGERLEFPSSSDVQNAVLKIKHQKLYPYFIEIVCDRRSGHSVNR